MPCPCPPCKEVYMDCRECRPKPDIKYECPPPKPVVLRCSVCYTAERDGCNVWSCVPFVSYSTFMGPTLGDLLIHVLNMLPLSVISWLGIGHPKVCIAKTPVKHAESPKAYGKKQCPICPGGGDISSSGDELGVWMHEEYLSLARELAELKRLTCEGEGDDNRELLAARSYVLDRLAEMLAKREQCEKRKKKKKQKGPDKPQKDKEPNNMN